MLSSALNTAVSGLRAAEVRLANSANNVANIQTTGRAPGQTFQPLQVVQSSEAAGGVSTSLQAVNPATVPVFDPGNAAADAEGITQYPNVNLEQELVNQKIATYDFKANLKVIEKTDEMTKDLLNILA